MKEELETQPVHESDWDYLIILDACRFDYFKKNYVDFLNGDLSKVRSRGSATPEWLQNTFSGNRYNYTYITANPYINAEGINLEKMTNEIDEDWHADRKVTQVHQAWDEAWDGENGTVLPEKMREYALEKEDKEKTIIHFVQPHRPFISYEGEEGHEWMPSEKNTTSTKNRIFSKTKSIWQPIFHNLPKPAKHYLREVLGMENQYRKFAKQVGEEKVKDLYTQDLRLALAEVEKLIEELDGKVVVTSDHGESFGENYEWGHPLKSKNPALIEVPWLEVK